jgi:O-antigen ligase
LLLFEILLVLYFDSKVNVLFLILAFVVLIIFKFKKNIFNLSFLKVILSILTLTLILNFDLIKDKSQLFIDKDRLILYRNIIPIIKENLIFGIGINNINNTLDSIMVNEKHIYIFNKLVYLKTPHSQYLFYLISGGITNLILFLVMFYVFIHLFIKKDNIYGFLFIILIMLNCLFEDFLNRAWGVYIFTFGTLILFNLRNKKNEIRV